MKKEDAPHNPAEKNQQETENIIWQITSINME